MSGGGSSGCVRHIAVSRSARYAILGEPGAETRDVWVVCHGYGQLATRFIERFQPIAGRGTLVVAPEALSRFYPEPAAGHHGPASVVGASWMTAEDREAEIADYVAYLNAVHDEIFSLLPRDSVTFRALGFSQGASTVARWIAAGHAKADQVILWAGSLPPELDSEAGPRLSAKNPMVIVAGRQDQFITEKVLEAQMASIAALGVRCELVRFDGGHDIDPSPLKSVRDLLAAKA